MVALEDAVDERAVDRPAILRLEFGQALAALLERRATVARPDECVERKARHAPRMALGEERGLQRARRDAIDQQLLRAGMAQHVFAAGGEIIGAVRDVEVDRPRFVRAAVAFVVHAPGVEAALGEPLHYR